MSDTDRPANGSDNATSQSRDGGGDPDQRPRDAATLVLVDMASGVPKVLMGRRRAGQVFMPSKVVFPGGRVDEADKLVRSGDALAPSETEKLLLEMKGHPSEVRARAMALAAVRETFEETGIRPDAAFLRLDTVIWVRVTTFSYSHIWGDEVYVIPVYCFGVRALDRRILLSHEHTAVRWLCYVDAYPLAEYDGNKTALWELDRRLRGLGPRAHA